MFETQRGGYVYKNQRYKKKKVTKKKTITQKTQPTRLLSKADIVATVESFSLLVVFP